jgi:hypothetical protein
MKKYYYLIVRLPAEPQDLEDGERIVETNIGNFKLPSEKGEGPFNSLIELMKSSKIYNSLLKSNPKRAQRIIEDRFLVKAEPVLYPEDGSEYLKHVYRIIQHANYGKIDRNGILGIHLYNPDKIKIIKIIKNKNLQGIWEAEIEVYNPNSKKWIKKAKPTTFFPENWNLQRLILECRRAFDERIEVTDTKYIGYTHSGIPVTLIFEDGVLKTIYPIYE